MANIIYKKKVSKLDLNEKYMQIVKQKIPLIAIIEIEGAGLERPL